MFSGLLSSLLSGERLTCPCGVHDVPQEVVEMGSSYLVLVVDDDPVYVKATKAILESHGYRVDSVRHDP